MWDHSGLDGEKFRSRNKAFAIPMVAMSTKARGCEGVTTAARFSLSSLQPQHSEICIDFPFFPQLASPNVSPHQREMARRDTVCGNGDFRPEIRQDVRSCPMGRAFCLRLRDFAFAAMVRIPRRMLGVAALGDTTAANDGEFPLAPLLSIVSIPPR